AILVALVSAFAFNVKTDKAKTFSTPYHYVGAYTDAEVKKPVNWVQESDDDCPTTGDAPCVILTNLNRANFDLMVQGFADVAAATAACSQRTFQ
ncbi:MAG: hypothetical protein ACQUYJ_06470, partial [Ferruginibacter sp.]